MQLNGLISTLDIWDFFRHISLTAPPGEKILRTTLIRCTYILIFLLSIARLFTVQYDTVLKLQLGGITFINYIVVTKIVKKTNIFS